MSARPSSPITVIPAQTGDGPRPAVLVLPGGGYAVHSERESVEFSAWLSGLGFHAFVLAYPVAPERHPRAVEEAAAALAWIRDGDHGLSVDPTRVGVLGGSAGGHLAAMLANGAGGAAVPRPAFSILCYPVISFEHDPHVGSMMNLLGEDPTLAERHAASVDVQVDERTPPAFVWFTATDAAVHVSNGLRYTDALARKGVPVELHVFPFGPHGLSLAQEEPHAAQWVGLCERWLTDFGWSAA
jgi:acetyl esterase/lipase